MDLCALAVRARVRLRRARLRRRPEADGQHPQGRASRTTARRSSTSSRRASHSTTTRARRRATRTRRSTTSCCTRSASSSRTSRSRSTTSRAPCKEVTMHDGSRIMLKKLEEDYDPTDTVQALQRLHRATEHGHMLTGLVFLQPEKKSFIEHAQRRRRAAEHRCRSSDPSVARGARQDHARADVGRPPVGRGLVVRAPRAGWDSRLQYSLRFRRCRPANHCLCASSAGRGTSRIQRIRHRAASHAACNRNCTPSARLHTPHPEELIHHPR